MLRVSKLADYATLLMVFLARHPGEAYAAKSIASSSHLSLPTVSKLLKILTNGGLLQSKRGAKGGYQLARDSGQITVADIIQAVEGAMSLTECAAAYSECALEQHCGVRGHWQQLSQAINQALASVSLASLLTPQVSTQQIDVSAIKALRYRG